MLLLTVYMYKVLALSCQSLQVAASSSIVNTLHEDSGAEVESVGLRWSAGSNRETLP